MADEAQTQAKEAIFKALQEVAESTQGIGATAAAAALRDVAYAWRALAGGPQPGGVVVESK